MCVRVFSSSPSACDQFRHFCVYYYYFLSCPSNTFSQKKQFLVAFSVDLTTTFLFKVENLLGCLKAKHPHILRGAFFFKRGEQVFPFPAIFFSPFDSVKRNKWETLFVQRGQKKKKKKQQRSFCWFWKISHLLFIFAPASSFFFLSFLRHGPVDPFSLRSIHFVPLSGGLCLVSFFCFCTKSFERKSFFACCSSLRPFVYVHSKKKNNCGAPLGTCAQRDSGRWCHRYDSPPSAAVQRVGCIKCTVSSVSSNRPLLPSFWIASSNGQNDARNI